MDSTWERPVYQSFDLVPCKDLGLMVCSVEGHIFVTKVKPYSVAGEDEKVEVGDNLVSIKIFNICYHRISILIHASGLDYSEFPPKKL